MKTTVFDGLRQSEVLGRLSKIQHLEPEQRFSELTVLLQAVRRTPLEKFVIAEYVKASKCTEEYFMV